MIQTIQKRDGRIVPFDPSKVAAVIAKAVRASGFDDSRSDLLARSATFIAEGRFGQALTVEQMQDCVETALMAEGWYDVARSYILYRHARTEQRRRNLVSEELRAVYRAGSAALGHDPLRTFQFFDKYARWNGERRETWPECVRRSFRFLRGLVAQEGRELPESFWGPLEEDVLAMLVMPSMRLLAMAGPAAERDNVSIYNCSFQVIDTLEAIRESLLISMAGCGDGYSVERRFVQELPFVRHQRAGAKPDVFVVPDSSVGWGDALLFGLHRWFEGHDVNYDYSEVRPEGALLRTKGGRASGPRPLREMLSFIRRLILSRQGSQLRPIDVNDVMTMTGTAGNSGGVRRAAKISISDWDDVEMQHAKDGEFWRHYPWRQYANNSAAWPDGGPSMMELMEQMGGMFRSGSGERGIFSRENALRTMPPARAIRLRETGHYIRIGTNPCQPASATVLTPTRIATIGDVDVGDVIWSGTQWTRIVAKMATGTKPVSRWRTTAGAFVGTTNHRVLSYGEKVEIGEAEVIDANQGPPLANIGELNLQDVVDGWVLGDGSVHRASNDLVFLHIGQNDHDLLSPPLAEYVLCHRPGLSETAYEVRTTIDAESLPLTYLRRVPGRFKFASLEKVRGFLRGLYSANGSVVRGRITLKAASFDIISDVQEMLSALGIGSYYTTNKPTEVQFSNGTYTCKQSYDLNITHGRHIFRQYIGFVQKYKSVLLDQVCAQQRSAGRRKTSFDIRSREDLGEMPVFALTVDDPDHTYWTGGLHVGNCGEIVLRSMSFCNLSIHVVRAEDTLEDLLRKQRAATALGTIQSLATHFPYLRPEWAENCREERLLGVDLMGQLDCPLTRDPAVLQLLREESRRANAELAGVLGIPASAAITCTKPGGNSGAFLGAAPSMQGYKMRCGIRNARVNTSSPVFRTLRQCKVPMDPENGQDAATADTWVVHFPWRAPAGATISKELSALQQLENWKRCKVHYTEHNPSVTIEYSPDELLDVVKWVWDNRTIIGGLSFLPRSESVYLQMPFEETSEEEFQRALAAFPEIDWSWIAAFEQEDQTTQAQTLACTAGGCEV